MDSRFFRFFAALKCELFRQTVAKTVAILLNEKC